MGEFQHVDKTSHSPRTKAGYLKRMNTCMMHIDCYICPNGHYRTTTREGYKQYASDSEICKSCSFLDNCTQSQLDETLWTQKSFNIGDAYFRCHESQKASKLDMGRTMSSLSQQINCIKISENPSSGEFLF